MSVCPGITIAREGKGRGGKGGRGGREGRERGEGREGKGRERE